MRPIPTEVVVGTTDPDASLAFLAAFGFAPVHEHAVGRPAARALYGLEDPTEEILLRASGVARGAIRLVRTPHHRPGTGGPLAPGPHAIDLYTRDIERSLDVARSVGGRTGAVGRYRIGPLTIAESKVVGPDHLVLVLIEVDRRRPSLLDREPARLHSEVHAAVWTVADVTAALPFWRDRVGLSVWLDTTVREPEVAKFMDLPRPDTPLRLAVLAAPDGQAPRFEMVAFPEDAAPAGTAGETLAAGLFALGCETPDVGAVVSALAEVAWGPVVAGAAGVPAVAGLVPGGIRLIVRSS